jgi:alpha-galactosidase
MTSRIVLIGAGSAMFGLGMLGDIFNRPSLAGSTVVLHDINPDALARVEGHARQYIEAEGLDYEIVATTSREEALMGADFCIISIEIGDRYELWEQDWTVPLQYGIPQVYGENGGPGGFFHALRIIPPILEICADIQALCPEAYVLNLSNPMMRISHAVHTKFPDLRYVGLCHEIASLPYHLPRMLDTPFSNLEIQAGGLNHFSVLLKARYKDSGADAYPDIRAKAPDYLAGLPGLGLFHVILERFGLLPITVDSHFGEYIPWAQDVVDHRGILDYYRNYKASCLEPPAPPQERLAAGTGEEEGWSVIDIIDALAAGKPYDVLAINVPNDGLIDNLPADQVVEAPGVIDADGIHGVKLGALPAGFAGLLMNQVAINRMTTETVLTGSREIALQALLVDPVVNSFHAAKQLLDTMLDYQAEYLSYIK